MTIGTTYSTPLGLNKDNVIEAFQIFLANNCLLYFYINVKHPYIFRDTIYKLEDIIKLTGLNPTTFRQCQYTEDIIMYKTTVIV